MNLRHSLRLLALLTVFGLLLAACDQIEEIAGTNIPERPSVVLQVGDQIFEQPVYSYCWPESAENLDCAINSDQLAQPNPPIDVATGADVRVQVTDGAGTPSSVTATLLDGPGGVQDLGASTDAAYTPVLAPGYYRVQVDVRFDDIEGQAAYVSYVFGLNVAGEVVAAAPTTTAEATEAMTEGAPIEVTPAPTLTAPPVIPAPTAEATEAPPVVTEEPAPVTEATTEAVAESLAATEEPTEQILVTAETVATVEAAEEIVTSPLLTAEAATTDEAVPAPMVTVAATEDAAALPLVTEEPAEAMGIADLTPEAVETEAAATAALAALETEPAVELTPDVLEAQPLGERTPAPTEGTAEAVAMATRPVLEPTAEATAEVAATEVPTESLGGLIGATVEATESEIASPTPEITSEAAVPTAEVTAEAGIEATAEATEAIEPLATAEVTAEATQPLVTEEPKADATEEVQPVTPTATATLRPTRTPIPPASPTVVLTPAGPAPVTATSAGPAEVEVPLLTITYAGEDYAPVGYQFCEVVTWGERVCANVPQPAAVPQRIRFLRGLTAELSLTGARPSSIVVEYRSDEGQPTGTPQTLEGDTTLDLLITPEAGSYIMVIHVTWEREQQDATYYFRVSVTD